MLLGDQFKKGLSRSKTGFLSRLNSIFSGGELDESFYEELEEALIAGDVGVQTTIMLVENLREEAKSLKINERSKVRELLKTMLVKLMDFEVIKPEQLATPYVILLVGVNGSGKTTSAAKLAALYKRSDQKVLLVAGDTFRAAAVEQLEIWAERAGVNIIKQQSGSDPSALFFDAMNAARARNIDIVIGDTAGRLHNKSNLMEELNKIYRVISRNCEGAPHEIMLVIDATTGNNALAQARSFNEILPLTGLILTKLDGTARGGIVIGIQHELKIPVRYIGTGEAIEDIVPFDSGEFINALL
jgi:fused signal recognition particle receptor